MRKLSLLGLGAALLAIAASPAAAAGPPSYAVSQATIKGRVAGFDGKYALSVRDDNGYVDRVQLHDGTVINPRGLTLRGGMAVTVYGRPMGDRFVADEIDTPYQRAYTYAPYPAYGPYPYYGYPYYGYPYYGYPHYGYPYYGPDWRLGIGVRIR